MAQQGNLPRDLARGHDGGDGNDMRGRTDRPDDRYRDDLGSQQRAFLDGDSSGGYYTGNDRNYGGGQSNYGTGDSGQAWGQRDSRLGDDRSGSPAGYGREAADPGPQPSPGHGGEWRSRSYAASQGYGAIPGDFGNDGAGGQNDRRHWDPDYHQWRSEQMRKLDNDYADWRRDRYKKFSDEFNSWRNSRASTTGAEASRAPGGGTAGDTAQSANGSSGDNDAGAGSTGKNK